MKFKTLLIGVGIVAATFAVGCNAQPTSEAKVPTTSNEVLTEEAVAEATMDEEALEKLMAQMAEADTPPEVVLDEEAMADYLQNDMTTTDSGLKYVIESQGTDVAPEAGSIVQVHYTGKLADGTVFDSSVERNEPAEFGVTEVIPGWTEALLMMSVGDKWRIACPPTLAYGEQGAGDAIPPNTALVFEIHLIEIKG